MKALSIKQPFASLIIHGLKTVEIRSWQTSYRGPVLICSGKKFHAAYRLNKQILGGTKLIWNKDFILQLIDPMFFVSENLLFFGHDEPIEFARGGRIGVANLINVRPMEPSDEAKSFCPYDPALFAWEFADPTPLPFLKLKGQLSLFNVSDEYAATSVSNTRD